MYHSDLEDHDRQGEEQTSDRSKDDMANRRISTHIPAPLRKKKYEDHKRFITPTGNPVAYLQKHMRSKSLSDLNEEKKEEEKHRAEINMRYEEMEKLKVLLKEEEDTWTSKLQSWKKRRRSVTEDARKRKEERDSLEKEAEMRSGRRRTKTYKEIVEAKMKRDKELAQLNDRDEYEFVSPRSSTSGADLPSPPPINSTRSQSLVNNPLITKTHIENMTSTATLLNSEPVPKRNTPPDPVIIQESQPDPAPVQYKYTTKVTAVINSPQKGAEYEDQQSASSVTISHPVVQSKVFNPVLNEPTPTISRPVGNQKFDEPAHKNPIVEMPSTMQNQQQSNHSMPRVLLRSKQSSPRRERPKSAHDLPSGSSTLPRSYRDYSSPKPFVPGATNFMQYRRAAFATRRDMWENMSVPTNRPTSAKDTPSIHTRNASDEVFASDSFLPKPDSQSHPQPASPRRNHETFDDEIPKVTHRMKMLQNRHSKDNPQHLEGSRGPHPPKVPLISESQVPIRKQQSTSSKIHPVSDAGLTATLSSNGLSMTSPQISKASLDITRQKKTEALFDDMKICINQRPRSEKGFGFTVRGGDDGKPVIVDTVSPGGAADICHLCVSDEILAINEVSLSDCKTQDDIVHLIVSSVITGNLSLNIRRYGKTKKTSPLRLSGTKVVMTPGGFVQVRSDKPPLQNTPLRMSTTPGFQRQAPTQNAVHIDNNNNDEKNRFATMQGGEDLPPPPTVEELDAISTYSTQSRRSPLSNLVAAASQNSNYMMNTPRKSLDSDVSENSFQGTALSEVYSSKSNQQDDEDELQREVSEAQRALDFEQVQQYDSHNEELRLKLEEEQRQLEMEEAQREEIRRRIQEEARLEDLKVQEELRKIEARKVRQQNERRKEMESMQKDRKPSMPRQNEKKAMRSNGPGQMTGGMHWMVEEAERRRVAEIEGKPRVSALEYGKRQSESALPVHVIQHLTQRASKPPGPRPFVRNVVGSSSNV